MPVAFPVPIQRSGRRALLHPFERLGQYRQVVEAPFSAKLGAAADLEEMRREPQPGILCSDTFPI